MIRQAVVLAFVGGVAVLSAQAPVERSAPTFEVASIKPNTSDAPPSSRFPLGPGDAYVAGSLFSATNQPLINYIRFAFGRSQGELLRLPSWVYDERFDIQARAAREATKDEMRLMIRALLAVRFSLAWHVEQREESVLELVVAKPGELGPQLTRHASDQPCGQDAPRADPKFDAIPCGAGLVSATSPGRSSISGRAEPLAKLAGLLSNNSFAGVDRVVVDRTGLTGPFDFTVEWAVPVRSVEPLSRPLGDDAGPPLDVAIRRQLGLTLRPTRARVEVLVIDSVERATPD
jgi:uncharacterized protein (TIGR03435 family)